MSSALPNLLTLARIYLIPLYIASYFISDPLTKWAALGIFIICALTDYADGWLARKLNAHSELGRFLDPIADKLLVNSVLIMLIAVGRIQGIDVLAALLILLREIFVSGLREFAGQGVSPKQIPVTNLAKWKTGLQMIAMIGLLLVDAYEPLESYIEVANAVLWLAAFVSLYTGYEYWRGFRARVLPA